MEREAIIEMMDIASRVFFKFLQFLFLIPYDKITLTRLKQLMENKQLRQLYK